MNTLLVVVAAAAASYWVDGGAPMGLSGLPQREPFQLNSEYKADYAKAELCALHPDDVDAVKLGDEAVYVVDGKSIEVFLDEYARRFAIDYCWQ